MAEVATAPPRFEMRGVRKAFGPTVALAGVDLDVRPGEVCALVGQNGAGKSTLMSILSGALQPDAGEMTLDGASYAPPSPHEARRAGVAMIYQGLSLAPHLSVMENIALGVEPTRWGFVRRDDIRQRATEALARLGHPDIPPETPVGRLPPAGQQLVEIARALGSGCRVLVLDEPDEQPRPRRRAPLFDLIARLKAQGLAIVDISHFIEEVKAVSDRFVVLRDGRNAGTGPTAETNAGAIVGLMVGRRSTSSIRAGRDAGEVILEVESLVPGSATFTLHRGEILGIAGLVGAGRTRLLRTLFGLEPVRSGRIRIGVYSGPAAPPHDGGRASGWSSEDRAGEGLAPGLSVAANLTASRLEGLGPGFVVLPSREDEAARRWIDALGIRCTSPASQLPRSPAAINRRSRSRGCCTTTSTCSCSTNRHAASTSRARRRSTRSSTSSSRQGVRRGQTGVRPAVDPATPRGRRPCCLVSSYLPELVGVCDRIAVMSRGRLGRAATGR